MEIASRLRDYTGLPQATEEISYVLGQYARAGVGVFLYNLGKAGRVLVSGVGRRLALGFYMDFAPSSEYNRDGSGWRKLDRPSRVVGRLGIK